MTSLVHLVAYLALTASVAIASPNSRWEAYKNQHGKRYDNPVEDAMRRQIFELKKVEVERFNAHEAPQAGYTKDLNHMSDWTEQEFNKTLGFRVDQKLPRLERSLEDKVFLDELLNGDEPVPEFVDWRKVAGRVTGVKNQGNCGACWSFATTGLLEGQEYKHASKNGIPLSEQTLIDCSGYNNGCDGGDMARALTDIVDIGGIDDEASYPYEEGDDNVCRFNRNNSVITDKGYIQLDANNEVDLMKAVARYGPVAVGLTATQDWTEYKSGIFSDARCDYYVPNHAVLIVGYGVDDKTKTDFWIIKNEWSEKWGMDGYILLERNKNRCNVASYPILAKF